MNIKSTRSIQSLSEVLMTPDATGPETAYWVFENISKGKWNNITILVSGRYEREYPKTYGHYHISSQEIECSKIISGSGIFMLQKKFYDSEGNWVPNKIESVYFVKSVAPPAEIVMIPKEYAHSWINIGDMPLVIYDDWREPKNGDESHTYNEIENLRGMAYYIVEGSDGTLEVIPNPLYNDIPEPLWVTSEEFNYLSRK